jgi:hypothetical protein
LSPVYDPPALDTLMMQVGVVDDEEALTSVNSTWTVAGSVAVMLVMVPVILDAEWCELAELRARNAQIINAKIMLTPIAFLAVIGSLVRFIVRLLSFGEVILLLHLPYYYLSRLVKSRHL